MSFLPVVSGEASLSRYLDEIHRLPFLSQEEEFMLAKRWQELGDIDAAHALVTSHLRLVAKIAIGFRGYGLPLMELISEGNIGLMHAVKKFDPDRGFRLSTYAMWWIRASIQEYVLRSWSLVKIGTTTAQKKLFFNLRRIKNRLKKLDENSLSPDEIKAIAQELSVTESEVVEMDSRLGQGDVSLNDPVFNDDSSGDEWIDRIDSKQVSQETLVLEHQEDLRKKRLFTKALTILSDRERLILSARRLQEEPATLDDLSREFKISRERVRQIENRAVEKLQEHVSNAA